LACGQMVVQQLGVELFDHLEIRSDA